jgi:hypothetical protein
MSEKMTKDKLLTLIQTEHEKLVKTLSRLSDDQLTLEGVEGEWSVKDLMAHITVWEERMISWLEAALQGETPEMLPAGLTWDDLDQWNQQTYLELKAKPLHDVRSDFDRVYGEALAVVKDSPEDDLIDPARYAWRDDTPLWEMVAANMNWHYTDHNETIQAWFEGLQTS